MTQITQCDATLGAVVRGISLKSPLGQADLDAIVQAWHQHAVLIFPGQHLSDDEQIAFTRYFGKLERGNRRSAKSGLSVLSNVQGDGVVAPPSSLQSRFLKGNTYWHTDSSYKRVGAKASLLGARTVPTTGGQTEFADMRAAWDALSDKDKAELDGKIAVHDYQFSHAPFGGLETLSVDELAQLPPVKHPMVRVHPDTGRKNLFVGRHASHVVGDNFEASRQRLHDLTQWACQPPRVLTHQWEVGDLVIWDNRCVLHRGHSWPAEQARVMVRTTVAGDAPDNEWVL
ncbi:MAG: TauD/TfdA family dioxygenase [Gammaproteobacteria bacterium]|nr:TauD/TfdA family dioxygenase [Gammaproteobacteria bacterium]